MIAKAEPPTVSMAAATDRICEARGSVKVPIVTSKGTRAAMMP